MKTPICDFVRDYIQAQTLRMHMPGHKGVGPLGVEHLDITEFSGADDLYAPSGIIAQSELNASELFGCFTVYSTEGSSQCIRAMVYLAMLHAKAQGKEPVFAAGCNAHKTFLTAAALLDVKVNWLCPEDTDSYISCSLTPKELERALSQNPVTAVYLTSPDYLGNVAGIAELSQVCHRHGALLLVDNAHGAYLRFLPRSLHPMDLGADLCCDSAHKTLSVITGGAYLHIKEPAAFSNVKKAMALFGSTSPSYLVLQSLDAGNLNLEIFPNILRKFLPQVQKLKSRLLEQGYCLQGNEPMKLTICPKSYGYTGTELAEILHRQKIVCEFADPDYLVLMVTPQTGQEGLARLEQALCSVCPRTPITEKPPVVKPCQQVLSPRQAILSVSQTVPVEQSLGRILAQPSVGCPPAVPIVLCGQRITEQAIAAFAYYGITHCDVVKEEGL